MIVGIFEIFIVRDFFGQFGCSVAKNRHFFLDFGSRKIGKNRNIKIPHDCFLCIPTRIMYANFWVNRTIFQRLVAIFL